MARPLTSKYSVELGYSFNLYLGNNLLPYKKAVLNQDFDCAVLIDGKEGSGKSVFAQQVACFLDKDNHLDVEKQICFTPEDFTLAVNSLEAGKAIVWDEARRGLNRRRSGGEVNLEITDMLAECRQNNLFLVIVMPTFYDMDMNVAVWRTRLLIHVWYTWGDDPENPLQRGFFRFYSEEGKKKLYTNKHCRQSYNYPFMKNDCFEASFPHYYCVNEKEYRQKKRSSENYYTKQKKNDTWGVIHHLKEKSMLCTGYIQAIADFLDISERTVYSRLSAAKTRINS